MADWAGALFFLALAIGIYAGLRILARRRTSSSEEFERRAAEGTLVGAGVNALHEVLNPAEARGKEVQMQLRGGEFDKKKREGKANDGVDD